MRLGEQKEEGKKDKTKKKSVKEEGQKQRIRREGKNIENWE